MRGEERSSGWLGCVFYTYFYLLLISNFSVFLVFNFLYFGVLEEENVGGCNTWSYLPACGPGIISLSLMVVVQNDRVHFGKASAIYLFFLVLHYTN